MEEGLSAWWLNTHVFSVYAPKIRSCPYTFHPRGSQEAKMSQQTKLDPPNLKHLRLPEYSKLNERQRKVHSSLSINPVPRYDT